MYSSEDLERFYFQYKTEALPLGMSIETFCLKNKVPYNIFQNGTRIRARRLWKFKWMEFPRRRSFDYGNFSVNVLIVRISDK